MLIAAMAEERTEGWVSPSILHSDKSFNVLYLFLLSYQIFSFNGFSPVNFSISV